MRVGRRFPEDDPDAVESEEPNQSDLFYINDSGFGVSFARPIICIGPNCECNNG